MEVEGEDGSKFVLEKGVKAVFGRGSGYDTSDRTVSRNHVWFQLSQTEPRVSFEVTGRNPIWVLSKRNGTIKVFRKFEKAELEPGDRFCLSGMTPIWFNLKQTEFQELENEETQNFQSEIDNGDVDVSGIDPVEEFGFVAMGREFEHYPKGMIRNVKDWEWFLEEPSKDSEDDDEEFEKRARRGAGRKRKKGKDNEDEEWTGESEDDDRNLVSKISKSKRLGYSTRSKDSKGPNKNTKDGRNVKQKKTSGVDATCEDEDYETLGCFIVSDNCEVEDDETPGCFIVSDNCEDEDGETLGCFIVSDKEEDQEEEDDEEEEFEEDDDDDDDQMED